MSPLRRERERKNLRQMIHVCALKEEFNGKEEKIMQYPKPIMSITELTKLGFSRDYLDRAVHSKHADYFARRTSKRGKFLIDTEKFEKAREKKMIGYQ